MKERLWTLTHSAALGTARASETVTGRVLLDRLPIALADK